jgi:sterol desaturase/sphingolipid hydroxylase (fatty acid hydroxylase superfamily)
MGHLLQAGIGRPGAYTIPLIALGLMVLEYLYGRLRHVDAYDARETAASWAIAVGNKLTRVVSAGIVAVPFFWVWEHRLFDIRLDHVWALAALVLGVEFFYYWHHVAMHRVKWLWATHGVHHSATRMNFSAAIRLGWGGDLTGGFLFYLPLAWLGFHPVGIVAVLGIGLLYQFFLHTTLAPRLGPLEWVFNTPRHHCVHHASNDTCLDKNFGSMLIVYDRLFGSFAEAPKNEPLRFGLKNKSVSPRQPLAIVLTGWLDIVRGLRRSATWRGRFEAVFGRP